MRLITILAAILVNTTLVDLVEEIEDSDLSVGETSISVRLFNDDWLIYVGMTSEVGQAQPRLGPHVWEGSADKSDSLGQLQPH